MPGKREKELIETLEKFKNSTSSDSAIKKKDAHIQWHLHKQDQGFSIGTIYGIRRYKGGSFFVPFLPIMLEVP